jgi:cell pole-organizing protein PopZ
MEEILASIRRIISDDKDAPPVPAQEPEEALELTQALQDDGSVVDLAKPEPEPKSEPKPEPEPAPAPAPPPPVRKPVDPPAPEPVAPPALVSEHVATEAASVLHTLANTVEIEELASAPRGNSLIGNGGRTLEDMVLELMRPLLRQWLDQNLPPIVDRLVQKEIERISRRAKD